MVTTTSHGETAVTDVMLHAQRVLGVMMVVAEVEAGEVLVAEAVVVIGVEVVLVVDVVAMEEAEEVLEIEVEEEEEEEVDLVAETEEADQTGMLTSRIYH